MTGGDDVVCVSPLVGVGGGGGGGEVEVEVEVVEGWRDGGAGVSPPDDDECGT